MQSYGSQALALGSTVNFDIGSGYEYVRIINESGYDCSANFTGMGTCSIPPWHLMDVPVINGNGKNMLTGQLTITPANDSSVNPSVFPSAYVKVDAFYPGELPAPYSVALTRLVSNVTNIATSLVNTGNLPGLNVINIMSNDVSVPEFTLNNRGDLSYGVASFGAVIPIISCTALGQNLILNAPTGKGIFFQNNVGNIASITSSGINLLGGVLSLIAGSISRISSFTASLTTVTTLFNHNLGVIPDIVICIPNGTSNAVFSYSCDYASLTSTQAKITGNTSFPVVGLAIKF